jgi:ubiquinone/menaquinone biosynthesis C-methylase UbiE
MSQGDYVLSNSASELERLRLQARVWEPETEAWLNRLGPMEGWHCLDLGCGAMGILGPLARRVGPSGRVVGVDMDPIQLRGARAFVAENVLANVEILEADATLLRFPPIRLISRMCASCLRRSGGMRSS